MKNRTSFRLLSLAMLVGLACQTIGLILPLATATATLTATLPPSPTPTPLPTATSTPSGPQPLSLSNFEQFRRLYKWDVQGGVVQVLGIAISDLVRRVALITLRPVGDYRLEVRDLEGNSIWENRLESTATYHGALTFSPDGRLIAIGLGNGEVQLWDSADGTLVNRFKYHRYAVRVIVFSRDGKMIASGGSDNRIGLWNVTTGKRIPTCTFMDPVRRRKCTPQNVTDVRDLAFSPDGRYLAVSAHVVVILDTTTGKEIDRFYDEEGDTRDLGETVFSPDGKTFVASGSWFSRENQRYVKRILLWTFPTTQNLARKISLIDAVEDLVFSADSKLLVGAYKDRGLIAIFDVNRREQVGTIDLGPITLLSYTPDVRMFAVLSTKTTVTIWGISP